MAKRRTPGGSRSSRGKRSESGWSERLEQQPVGAFGVGVVAVGWIVLALLYFTKVWSLEVVFFLAVGLLTFVLGCMSLFAALTQARSARPRRLFELPGWLKEFEDYFRWLTPVAFLFGLIFAHYFWH